MKIRAVVLAVTALAAVAFTAPVASGATGNDQFRVPKAQAPKSPKLESGLADVARTQKASGKGLERAKALGLPVADGLVRVVAEARGDRGAAENAVAAAGGRVEATHADLVQALVAPGAIEGLSRSAAVAYLRAPHTPVEQAITGEEIALSGVDNFQAALWNGTGQKVAIVDAGFAGLAARQANGDLPMGVVTQDMCGGQFGTASEHGTAVAEIVHEVAPQAQLHLICIDSDVTMGQAETYVKNNGIPIVNMSLAFLNAGRGDGVIGLVNQIVADARANNILWVNSAGNYQQRHWSGNFTDDDGDDVHNFTPVDEGNTIALNTGQQSCVFLKWDDWPGSAQDFDLYLVRSADSAIVAFSENFQTGSQTPTEEFCFTNGGGPQNFFIAITRFDATFAPRFDMIATFPNLEYKVEAGSIIEPASSPNAMAVGALCFADGLLRSYSSLGPTIDDRIKPDIAGLDGVSGGTYGIPSGCSGGFTGTSASSPHVAGLAALARHQNPSLTAAQLQTWLEARARDVYSPGRDIFTGAGRAYVQTFTDASPWGTPLQNYIEQLFTKGTTTGCTLLNPATGIRLYCPDDPVSRLAMAIFIVRSMGLTELFPPAATFADVPVGSFGRGFVERLFEQGITTGCAVGPPALYCPNDPVSRLAMAIFIVRAKGWAEIFPLPATFADVPDGAFGRGFVERFYAEGVTTGCAIAPLRYCPSDVVDRKAMAAFLIRAFGAPTP